MKVKIAIIGIELCQLVCAHKILDNDSNLKIHLISENAEAGLIGELPGLITQPFSNTIPTEWIGELDPKYQHRQTPRYGVHG